MSQLESLTGCYNGYMIGKLSYNLGWTFFKMTLKPELEDSIRKRFSSMIDKYKMGDQDSKFMRFMNEYFDYKGCNVKLQI